MSHDLLYIFIFALKIATIFASQMLKIKDENYFNEKGIILKHLETFEPFSSLFPSNEDKRTFVNGLDIEPRQAYYMSFTDLLVAFESPLTYIIDGGFEDSFSRIACIIFEFLDTNQRTCFLLKLLKKPQLYNEVWNRICTSKKLNRFILPLYLWKKYNVPPDALHALHKLINFWSIKSYFSLEERIEKGIHLVEKESSAWKSSGKKGKEMKMKMTKNHHSENDLFEDNRERLPVVVVKSPFATDMFPFLLINFYAISSHYLVKDVVSNVRKHLNVTAEQYPTINLLIDRIILSRNDKISKIYSDFKDAEDSLLYLTYSDQDVEEDDFILI